MKRLISLALVMICTHSMAGSLGCEGTVEAVAYHGNDKLMVQLSSMNAPVFFCNPNQQWSVPGAEGRVMSGETCKTVFSMLLTARTTQQYVQRIHFDGDSVPASCGEFANQAEVFIRYVKI